MEPDGRPIVRFEYVLPDGTKADYVLTDRTAGPWPYRGQAHAIDPSGARQQAIDYAEQVGVPLIFLANGKEIWFWDHEREAHPHRSRRSSARRTWSAAPLPATRRDPMAVEIDHAHRRMRLTRATASTRCAGRSRSGAASCWSRWRPAPARPAWPPPSSSACSRPMLVTRVLFLVDRIPLAKQTEDAFAEHLAGLPAYVLRAGRRFQDEKRITITTLQSMVNIYADYSSGYFDLDHLRRVPPLDLRQMVRRAEALRWHPDRPDRNALRASPEVLASLEDEEDRAFVRDTLRFFEVDRPTFRYTLEAGHPGRLPGALPDLPGADREDRGRGRLRGQAGGTRLVRDGCGDPSGIRAAVRRPDTITVDPNALERRFTIPERNRAMVREFREVVAERLHRPGRRPALAAGWQDDRVRRHQAPRRNAGPDVR